MASMMQNNLKMAYDQNQKSHVLPSFIISNFNYEGVFEEQPADKNKLTVVRTLWDETKKQFGDLLKIKKTFLLKTTLI